MPSSVKLQVSKRPPVAALLRVPKSDEPNRPLLDSRLGGYRARLTGSLVIAIAVTCVLGALLALVVSRHQIFTAEETAVPMEVTSVIDDTPPPDKKVKEHIRHSLVAVNDRKAPVVPIYEKPTEPELAAVTPPTPELDPTVDLQAVEETFESAWKEPKKAKPKPVAKPKRVAKVEKKAPDQREIDARNKKRAQARAAKLAKKISKQAQVVSRSTPAYPRSARRKGIEGRVVVTVTVSPSGRVSGSAISKSSRNSSLDAAALKAARKFKFSPAKNGLGQPVAVRRSIPFTFKIQG